MTTVLDKIEKSFGWKEIPLRAVGLKVSEAGYPDLESLSVFLDAGVVPRSSRDDNHNQLGDSLEKYQRVLPHDLVFNKLRTWQGGFGISEYEGIVSPAYIIVRLNTEIIYPRFLGYLLKSKPYLDELTRLSKWMPPTQFDISWESLRDLQLRIPSKEVQRQIVDRLDEELQTIDRAIELRRAQISNERILQELTRKSLVLPKNIELMPLKYITTLSYGDALPSEDRIDGDIPVMSSGGISGSHSMANTHAPVIVVGRKGSFGSVHWSNEAAFVIDTAYYVDDRNTQVHLKWLYHLLKSCDLNTYSIDVGIPGLSRESTYAKLVPIPPDPHSQLKLAKEIDEAMAKFDHKILKLEKSIELLSEYRSSLITALVSGTSIQNIR